VTDRRPVRSLEAEVLEVLWSADGAMTPAQVRAAMPDPLAYTTVMTVLVRAWQKGLVERVKAGRAFAYSAVVDEADLVAERMRREYERSRDPFATMSRFVGHLDATEAAELRRLLDEDLA
jgi:predicted transcriptional regulator